MSTHNLFFEQKYENYQNFSSESFHFLVVKFSIYLNRRVFVMIVSVQIIRVNNYGKPDIGPDKETTQMMMILLFFHKDILCILTGIPSPMSTNKICFGVKITKIVINRCPAEPGYTLSLQNPDQLASSTDLDLHCLPLSM